MVDGKLKSRRLRRVKVRTISGTKTQYVLRNRQIAKCAVTGKPLRGIPRKTPKKFGKMAKSQKTVSRKYGGYLSHQALKEKILNEMVLNN
jgi:large subunit ribosomal protein L34e